MNSNTSFNFRFSFSMLFAVVMAVSVPFDACALGIAVDADELFEQAELVIIGKVIDKTGVKMELNAQVPDGVQEPETYFPIMTKYEIEIADIRKGAFESKKIDVFSFGGRAGDEIERWSFGFNFSTGDDVLLFLKKSKANGIWIAVQHSIGVFLLTKHDGRWQVSGMNSGHVVVREGGDPDEFQKRTIENLESYINGGKK